MTRNPHSWSKFVGWSFLGRPTAYPQASSKSMTLICHLCQPMPVHKHDPLISLGGLVSMVKTANPNTTSWPQPTTTKTMATTTTRVPLRGAKTTTTAATTTAATTTSNNHQLITTAMTATTATTTPTTINSKKQQQSHTNQSHFSISCWVIRNMPPWTLNHRFEHQPSNRPLNPIFSFPPTVNPIGCRSWPRLVRYHGIASGTQLRRWDRLWMLSRRRNLGLP